MSQTILYRTLDGEPRRTTIAAEPDFKPRNSGNEYFGAGRDLLGVWIQPKSGRVIVHRCSRWQGSAGDWYEVASPSLIRSLWEDYGHSLPALADMLANMVEADEDYEEVGP